MKRRKAIVEASAKVGAWIVSDEVYRGAEMDGVMTPTFWGAYERILCTGGLSKAYSLPGLRTGWVVGPADMIERLWSYHDYTSIGPSMLTDRLASVALEPKRREWILDRTRKSSAAELSGDARVAGCARGFVLAHCTEGGSDCMGRIARRRRFRADGRRVAREEKRPDRSGRAIGNGFIRAIRIWRRSKAFARSAWANWGLDERSALLDSLR